MPPELFAVVEAFEVSELLDDDEQQVMPRTTTGTKRNRRMELKSRCGD
jgi:hypothetical protein